MVTPEDLQKRRDGAEVVDRNNSLSTQELAQLMIMQKPPIFSMVMENWFSSKRHGEKQATKQR